MSPSHDDTSPHITSLRGSPAGVSLGTSPDVSQSFSGGLADKTAVGSNLEEEPESGLEEMVSVSSQEDFRGCFHMQCLCVLVPADLTVSPHPEQVPLWDRMSGC